MSKFQELLKRGGGDARIEIEGPYGSVRLVADDHTDPDAEWYVEDGFTTDIHPYPFAEALALAAERFAALAPDDHDRDED